MEQTLSIIKPDATKRNLIGQILERFENAGLRIVALKRLHLTYEQAAQFYAVHKDRPFFDELCTVISSGPIVVQVLEGPQAILKNRELMGATDPAAAIPGTIRADLSLSISENSVHGSDSPQTAVEEIAFFFKPEEILPA